jgi:hypothetical protein
MPTDVSRQGITCVFNLLKPETEISVFNLLKPETERSIRKDYALRQTQS